MNYKFFFFFFMRRLEASQACILFSWCTEMSARFFPRCTPNRRKSTPISLSWGRWAGKLTKTKTRPSVRPLLQWGEGVKNTPVVHQCTQQETRLYLIKCILSIFCVPNNETFDIMLEPDYQRNNIQRLNRETSSSSDVRKILSPISVIKSEFNFIV